MSGSYTELVAIFQTWEGRGHCVVQKRQAIRTYLSFLSNLDLPLNHHPKEV